MEANYIEYQNKSETELQAMEERLEDSILQNNLEKSRDLIFEASRMDCFPAPSSACVNQSNEFESCMVSECQQDDDFVLVTCCSDEVPSPYLCAPIPSILESTSVTTEG